MGLIRPTAGDDPRLRPAGRRRARRCCPGSARSSRGPASCRTCPAWRTCGCTGRRPAGRRRTRTSTRRWRSPGSATRSTAGSRTYSHGMRQRLGDRPGHARPAGAAGARRADQRARPAADPRDARGAAALRRRPGAPCWCPATCWPRWSRPAPTWWSCTRARSWPSGTVDEIIAGGGAASFTCRRRPTRRPPRCSAGSTACAASRSTATPVHAELDGTAAADGGGALVTAGRRGRRPVRGGAWRTRSCSSWARTRRDDRPDGRRAGDRGPARPPRRGARTVHRRRHVGALPLVDHAPYRPARTLPVRVELVRQLRRRRTQVAFALVVLLPVILWSRSSSGDDGPPRRRAEPRRPRHGQRAQLRAVRAVRLGRRSCWSWSWRCSSATRWPARRAGRACATCSPRRSPGPGCCGRRRSWPGCSRWSRCSCCRSWRCSWAPSRTAANAWSAPTGESLPFAGRGCSGCCCGARLRRPCTCWVAGLALLLSVSTDAPLGAVGGAVLAVDPVPDPRPDHRARTSCATTCPRTSATPGPGLLADQIDWGDMIRGAFSAIAYAAVFFALACWRFARKDITS